jgi:hypothetical protein
MTGRNSHRNAAVDTDEMNYHRGLSPSHPSLWMFARQRISPLTHWMNLAISRLDGLQAGTGAVSMVANKKTALRLNSRCKKRSVVDR